MSDKENHVRVGKLVTVGDAKYELGRLYRAARKGKLDTLDASRLASILKVMIDAIKTTEFEDRLTALEQHHERH